MARCADHRGRGRFDGVVWECARSLCVCVLHGLNETKYAHQPQNRSTGIPTVVAVDPKGHVLAHMDADREGMEALEQWRYKEWTW